MPPRAYPVSIEDIDEWIPAPVAQAILRVSRPMLLRVASEGRIRVMRVGGGWPKYSRSDCLRVAEESTSKLVSPSR